MNYTEKLEILRHRHELCIEEKNKKIKDLEHEIIVKNDIIKDFLKRENDNTEYIKNDFILMIYKSHIEKIIDSYIKDINHIKKEFFRIDTNYLDSVDYKEYNDIHSEIINLIAMPSQLKIIEESFPPHKSLSPAARHNSAQADYEMELKVMEEFRSRNLDWKITRTLTRTQNLKNKIKIIKVQNGIENLNNLSKTNIIMGVILVPIILFYVFCFLEIFKSFINYMLYFLQI